MGAGVQTLQREVAAPGTGILIDARNASNVVPTTSDVSKIRVLKAARARNCLRTEA